MKSMKVALLALATLGLSMPVAQAQYSSYSGVWTGQPSTYQQNRIWNNPNDRNNRRQQALLRKLQQRLSVLEMRVRARGISWRERLRCNNEIRDLRRQISSLFNDNRRY